MLNPVQARTLLRHLRTCRRAVPGLVAFFASMYYSALRPKEAHAALGESREAAHAVAQSEAAFDNVQHDDEPEWARFIDTTYLAGEWANAFGDIARPVESTLLPARSFQDRSGS